MYVRHSPPQEYIEKQEKAQQNNEVQRFLQAKATAASTSARGRASASSSSGTLSLPAAFLVGDDSRLRALLPDETYKHYHDKVNRRTQVFHKTMGSRSRAWGLYGFYRAACMALQAAWQHAIATGTQAACPFESELQRRTAPA